MRGSFRTLHDIKECHTDTQLYLLLHPTSFTYPPDPSSRGSSQRSLHCLFTFHPRQTVRNRKTSKEESDVTRWVFQKDRSGYSVDGVLKRAGLEAGKAGNRLLQ